MHHKSKLQKLLMTDLGLMYEMLNTTFFGGSLPPFSVCTNNAR